MAYPVFDARPIDETLMLPDFEKDTSKLIDTDADKVQARRERVFQQQLHAFRELLETERNYLRDLSILLEVFLQPLAGLPWIDDAQKRLIARNASEIQQCHTLLLEGIDTALTTHVFSRTLPEHTTEEVVWDDASDAMTLGGVFLEQRDDFFAYVEYCTLHDSALRVLTQLSTNNKWKTFLEGTKQRLREYQVDTRLTLQDYLIKPVQRLCQYPMVLKNLLPFFAQTSRNYRDINNAIAMLRCVANSIDEYKRMEDMHERTELFISRLDDVSIQRYPDILHGSNVVLLLAGALEVIDYQRQPKPRIKYYGCFLFENHLVIARARRTTHYEIVERLNLEKMTIARLNRDPAVTPLKYPWRLRCTVSGNYYDFGAAGERERKLWLDKLDQLVPSYSIDDDCCDMSVYSAEWDHPEPSPSGCSSPTVAVHRQSVDCFSESSDATLVDALSATAHRTHHSRKSVSGKSTGTTSGFTRGALVRRCSDTLTVLDELPQRISASANCSRNNSLVQRILPVRRAKSVEFRTQWLKAHSPPHQLLASLAQMTGRHSANSTPPPLASWKLPMAGTSDSTPSNRAAIEQRFSDVFTTDRQTVHALEMRMQVAVPKEESDLPPLPPEAQASSDASVSSCEPDQDFGAWPDPAKAAPRSPLRLSATAPSSTTPTRNPSLRNKTRIAHHSLSLTISSAKLAAQSSSDSPEDTMEPSSPRSPTSPTKFSYTSRSRMHRPPRVSSLVISKPAANDAPLSPEITLTPVPDDEPVTLFDSYHPSTPTRSGTAPAAVPGSQTLAQTLTPMINVTTSFSMADLDDLEMQASSPTSAVSRLLRNTFRRARRTTVGGDTSERHIMADIKSTSPSLSPPQLTLRPTRTLANRSSAPSLNVSLQGSNNAIAPQGRLNLSKLKTNSAVFRQDHRHNSHPSRKSSQRYTYPDVANLFRSPAGAK